MPTTVTWQEVFLLELAGVGAGCGPVLIRTRI